MGVVGGWWLALGVVGFGGGWLITVKSIHMFGALYVRKVHFFSDRCASYFLQINLSLYVLSLKQTNKLHSIMAPTRSGKTRSSVGAAGISKKVSKTSSAAAVVGAVPSSEEAADVMSWAHLEVELRPTLSKYVHDLLETGGELSAGDEESGMNWKALLFTWLVARGGVSESSLDQHGPSVTKLTKSIWRDAVTEKHAAEDAAEAGGGAGAGGGAAGDAGGAGPSKSKGGAGGAGPSKSKGGAGGAGPSKSKKRSASDALDVPTVLVSKPNPKLSPRLVPTYPSRGSGKKRSSGGGLPVAVAAPGGSGGPSRHVSYFEKYHGNAGLLDEELTALGVSLDDVPASDRAVALSIFEAHKSMNDKIKELDSKYCCDVNSLKNRIAEVTANMQEDSSYINGLCLAKHASLQQTIATKRQMLQIAPEALADPEEYRRSLDAETENLQSGTYRQSIISAAVSGLTDELAFLNARLSSSLEKKGKYDIFRVRYAESSMLASGSGSGSGSRSRVSGASGSGSGSGQKRQKKSAAPLANNSGGGSGGLRSPPTVDEHASTVHESTVKSLKASLDASFPEGENGIHGEHTLGEVEWTPCDCAWCNLPADDEGHTDHGLINPRYPIRIGSLTVSGEVGESAFWLVSTKRSSQSDGPSMLGPKSQRESIFERAFGFSRMNSDHPSDPTLPADMSTASDSEKSKYLYAKGKEEGFPNNFFVFWNKTTLLLVPRCLYNPGTIENILAEFPDMQHSSGLFVGNRDRMSKVPLMTIFGDVGYNTDVEKTVVDEFLTPHPTTGEPMLQKIHNTLFSPDYPLNHRAEKHKLVKNIMGLENNTLSKEELKTMFKPALVELYRSLTGNAPASGSEEDDE